MPQVINISSILGIAKKPVNFKELLFSAAGCLSQNPPGTSDLKETCTLLEHSV